MGNSKESPRVDPPCLGSGCHIRFSCMLFSVGVLSLADASGCTYSWYYWLDIGKSMGTYSKGP